MTDNRRVKDVKPSNRQTIDDFYGDRLLFACGYVGEAKTMQTRIRRIHQLEAEGRGPGAELQRFLAELGYRPRPRWPVLDFAWNATPSPAWAAALAADAKGQRHG